MKRTALERWLSNTPPPKRPRESAKDSSNASSETVERMASLLERLQQEQNVPFAFHPKSKHIYIRTTDRDKFNDFMLTHKCSMKSFTIMAVLPKAWGLVRTGIH